MTVLMSIGKAFVLHFAVFFFDFNKIMNHIVDSPNIVIVMSLSIFFCIVNKDEFLEIMLFFAIIEGSLFAGCSLIVVFLLITAVGILVMVYKIYKLLIYVAVVMEVLKRLKNLMALLGLDKEADAFFHEALLRHEWSRNLCSMSFNR